MNFKVLISAIFASTIAVVGCETSSDGGAAGSGGTAGGGGAGGGEGGAGGAPSPPWVPIADCDDIDIPTEYSIEGAPETPTDDCDTTLSASGTNDAAKINAAIELASSGDTICLEAGEYDMEASVVVSGSQDLTVKGIGPSVMDVKLDYQGRGDRGFDVTVDGFHIENMWIVNTAGNGVEIKAADSIFRKLYVSWDAGAVSANGAYAVYPTLCKDTLVEYVEVVGASDAGIYVGVCEGGTIRYNKVYSNVAGMEVENCLNVELYGNETFDNVAGILPLQEPDLPRLTNSNIVFRNNLSYCNNHENFAREGTTVSFIPPGLGALVLGGDGVEVRDNIFDSNGSSGVLLASTVLLCQISDGDKDCTPQMGFNPYPENIAVFDNQYINNGNDPQGIVADLSLIIAEWRDNGVSDMVWDGYTNPATEDPNVCLGEAERASYTDMTSDECQTAATEGDFILCINTNNTQDPAGRDCTLPPIVIP